VWYQELVVPSVVACLAAGPAMPVQAPGAPPPAAAQEAAPPGGPRITHEPVACVVAGTYPRIEAAATPAEDVAGVRLRFTTSGSKGWFATPMANEDGTWRAVLPRPRGGLREFRYTIEASGVAADNTSTPEVVVKVVKSDADCRNARVAQAVKPERSLLVEGPPNGPRKNPPLVPRGFSPVGVVGHVGVFDLTTPVAVTGAVVVGGGLLAGAVAWGRQQHAPVTLPPPQEGYEFAFGGSSPSPGATVSLRQPLAINVRVTVPADLSPGSMRVILLDAGNNGACINLSVRHGGLRANTPQVLTVSGPPFFPQALCGSSFTTSRARVVLAEATNRELVSTGPHIPDLDFGYSFVP
jgi:hypothetical protein